MSTATTQFQPSSLTPSATEQIRLLTRAIAASDDGPTRSQLIARRDKLIAVRMTPLLAGRPRGFVAPIPPLEDRS